MSMCLPLSAISIHRDIIQFKTTRSLDYLFKVQTIARKQMRLLDYYGNYLNYGLKGFWSDEYFWLDVLSDNDQKFIGDWAYIAVIVAALRGVLPWSRLLSAWVILSLWIHSVQLFFWGILTSILSLLMLLIVPRYPLSGPLPIVILLPILRSYYSAPNPGFTPVFMKPFPTLSRFLATALQLSAFSTTIPQLLLNSGLNKKRKSR